MRDWKIDFATLLAVQFIASAGFSVANPFIPLYIQELGVHGVQEAALWSGIIGAAGGIMLAVASPIWGSLADRHGRKVMVVRATMGAGVFQGLMGLAANVQQLLALRTLQSMVSGVQAAVLAVAATIIPRESLGFAMGSLETANSLGNTLGPFIGGVLAVALGYRSTFFLTGVLLFLSSSLAAFAIHEVSIPSTMHKQQAPLLSGLKEVLRVPGMTGVLLVLAASRAAASMMTIAVPLIVQEMAGGNLNVSTETGAIVGLMAVAMACGAVFWGRLGDRIGQMRIVHICLLLAILSIVPQALVHTPWQLAIGQMIYTASLAGLLPSANALAGLLGPKGKMGAVYGSSGMALALGNALGPTLAGFLIALLGTHILFVGVGLLLAALYVSLGALFTPAARLEMHT